MSVAGNVLRDQSIRVRRYVVVGAVSLTIAFAWVGSSFTVKQLQVGCKYSKPFLITYIHEVVLCLVSAPIAACAQRSQNEDGERGLSCIAEGRRMMLKAASFGILAFAANICFTAALGYTQTSTAMTLEQCTSVFIAVLSCFMLGERYRASQLLGLAIAITGGVVIAQSGANATTAAPKPLLGDFLVLMCSALAATYMVLFKWVFSEGFGLRTLFIFFSMKGICVAGVGWIGFLFAERGLPDNTCGWAYLGVNSVLQVFFNVGLAWGTVAVSPLAARLFILLGLPLGLLVDVAEGAGILLWHAVGIALAVTGVAIFQGCSNASTTPANADHLDCDETSNPTDNICEASVPGALDESSE